MSWILYTPDAFPSTCCVRKPFGINGRPSCDQTNSVKALKETQSTDRNQRKSPLDGVIALWPDIFFIHHWTTEIGDIAPFTPAL